MLTCACVCMAYLVVLSCDSIHAVQMRCGSGSGNGKNRKHGKYDYECLIPFMRSGSRTACSGVAIFFPLHGAIYATAAKSGHGLHSRQFFFLTSYKSICTAWHGCILLWQKLCGISGSKNREVNPYERHETHVYRLFGKLLCLWRTWHQIIPNLLRLCLCMSSCWQ